MRDCCVFEKILHFFTNLGVSDEEDLVCGSFVFVLKLTINLAIKF
jgi:hypothetical protein